MSWASLNLWADEEQKIYQCLAEALQKLMMAQIVLPSDEEKQITAKLRPILKRICIENRLDWTIHFEASSFENETEIEPTAHPDIRFSRRDPEYNQYDYDVECKLVRIERANQKTDYCYHYITKGIVRYQTTKYAQSSPPMGTMLGYVTVGDILLLLRTINRKLRYQQRRKHKGMNQIQLKGTVQKGDITHLTQHLQRETDQMQLLHLWADLREPDES